MPALPFFLFFICSCVIISIPTTASLPRTRKSAAVLFIFGDSYFDPGNNNYINTTTLDQANFRPYGETYFKYPTGRFSDGRLISDFIEFCFSTCLAHDTMIAEHANLPLIPPYLQQRNNHQMNNYHGVNFASAGAGALSQTYKGSVIDIKTQLRYYKREVRRLRLRLGNAAAKKISSNAVYLFSIGSNDYSSPFVMNSTVLQQSSRSQYVGMVIGNLTNIIKEIYRKGGRKFGFMNLGELGCVPGLRILETNSEGGCLEEASNVAKLHNNALSIILSKMEQQLHGFKYFLYDFNSDLAQKTNQPMKYGFKEGQKACCGTGRFNGIFSCGGKRLVTDYELCENPNEFVFWDSYHLTEKVHKQMADHMWVGSETGTNSLKDLFHSL